MAIVRGKTSTGFSFKADSEQLTNAEFLEVFAEVQKGDAMGSFALIRILLGEEQKNQLYDHCRNKKGMVPVEKLAEELGDIVKRLSEAAETKNSLPSP